MDRRLLRVAAGFGALALISACAQAPGGPTSPTSAASSSTANPDGSTLKVSAPSLASPIGGTRVTTVRPTFTFAAATGRFAATLPTHRLEVLDAAGTVIAARTIAAGQTSFAADTDLATNTNYLWRVRAELDGAVGPWSGIESFATPVPVVAPPTGGGLPFPIPAACGPGGASDRLPCVRAVAALSNEWSRCARGSAIGCHRFTRQVAFSLAQSDPGWRMIIAAPGGLACDCNRCAAGLGNGSTFVREDTVVYSDGRVYDMVGGAGGPTPSLQWSGPFGLAGQGRTVPVLCE
ncbi:hypothetical protein [Luteitalea sp.]|uniref:hypothetical protein n=1 Tax=Luteitalea sp. TaxID=2004800 RepID=UPI0025BCE297|nr:hypothetical protein [Luteitalea sp.]